MLTPPDDTHPCNDCGETYYERMGAVYWLASDELWAAVVGDTSIVLCPPCWGARARAAGVPFHWRALPGV